MNRPKSPRLGRIAPTSARSSAGAVPTTCPRPSHSIRGWVVSLLATGLLLATILATSACGSSTAAQNPTPSGSGFSPTVVVPSSVTDLEQTIQSVIHRAQPSIVEVQSSGSQGQAIGSGEVIATGGYIVTNDHVVHGFQQFMVVLATGEAVTATLAGEAPSDDLAVLKASATSLRPITLGDSSTVQVGSFVLAIGSPLGLDQSATFGIVSALNRTASEAPSGPAGTLTGLIQTSAPINPGNSGGALLNLRGELIGIPTLGAGSSNGAGAANGIGFAIASNRVKFVTDQLIKSGHMTSTGQGYLGIVGADITPDIASAYGLPTDHGVLIVSFGPDASGKSPAERAGLLRDDIILAINQSPVTGNGDLSGALLSLAPGSRIVVTVQRGTSQQHINVILGERPAA